MARTKKARRIRTNDEFAMAQLQRAVSPPITTSSEFTWTVEEIVDARNQQIQGVFWLPAKLAISMRTDDALFVAYENRLDPVRALAPIIDAAPGARGKVIAKEADAAFSAEGVGIECGTFADINGDLANHGVAFGFNTWTVREDGSRVDCLHRHWPIENVRFDHTTRTYVTRIDTLSELAQSGTEDRPVDEETGRELFRSGSEIPIIHGDGRWAIYQKHSYRPFRQEACILPGALIWARHAHSIRDWAKGSTSHGNAKVVGELPPNIPLTDPDGNIQPEAAAFLELLKGMARLDTPVGIRPSGAKTDYVVNSSQAWQVWRELALNGEKAAARVYLGTDGMLGSVGGAPGVDIATLFGIATTKVQGDLDALKIGFKTGTLEPWTAINHGDSTLTPTRRYVMPDPDADAEREAHAKRSTAFYDEIQRMKDAGFVVDEDKVNELSKLHGIPAPVLVVASAPTDPVVTDAPPAVELVS